MLLNKSKNISKANQLKSINNKTLFDRILVMNEESQVK